jgi:hypothetical protein
MRPIREPDQPQRELFQGELELIIDRHHPLVQLGMRNDWASFEESLGATYHPTPGALGISTRLMVALHYFEVSARSERRERGGALGGEPLLAALQRRALLSASGSDRAVEHDALAAAAGRSRGRADAARHHRDGDRAGRHRSGTTEAQQREYNRAERHGSGAVEKCADNRRRPRGAFPAMHQDSSSRDAVLDCREDGVEPCNPDGSCIANRKK